MGKILNIETATRICSVALSDNGQVIAMQESNTKNSHAEQITVFSEQIIYKSGISFSDLDAIAISKGPGSYTGLRIGVSTAKGFCYSLDKPLLSIGTLDALAAGIIAKMKEAGEKLEDMIFCPMIDARRMEVYAAVFDAQLHLIRETKAEIIDENSFADLFKTGKKIIFVGDGAAKCKAMLGNHEQAIFPEEFLPSAAFMAPLAEAKFNKQEFEDPAYFEPFYLKDFIPGISRVKGLRD